MLGFRVFYCTDQGSLAGLIIYIIIIQKFLSIFNRPGSTATRNMSNDDDHPECTKKLLKSLQHHQLLKAAYHLTNHLFSYSQILCVEVLKVQWRTWCPMQVSFYGATVHPIGIVETFHDFSIRSNSGALFPKKCAHFDKLFFFKK